MKLNINGFFDSFKIPFYYEEPESTTPRRQTSFWDNVKYHLFIRGGNRKAFNDMCESSKIRNAINQMSYFFTTSFQMTAAHLSGELGLKNCQSHAASFNQYLKDYDIAVKKAASEYCNRVNKEIKSEYLRYVALETSFDYFTSKMHAIRSRFVSALRSVSTF